MQPRNLTKPFSIAGFIFGEAYMLFAALAPSYSNGAPVEFAGKLARIAAGIIFFGPFGAAMGLGVGILVGALWKKQKDEPMTSDESRD